MTTQHLMSRRRYFRYSLRTLFSAMTAVAVLVWWIDLQVTQARDQRIAVELVKTVGGTPQYEHQAANFDPPGGIYLRSLLEDHYFFRVTTLFLGGTQVTDKDFETIARLNDVRVLYIFNTPITDAAAGHLERMTTLETLSLRDTQTTDAGLEHLAALTRLRTLNLGGTQVTGAGVNKLRRALPDCNVIFPDVSYP